MRNDSVSRIPALDELGDEFVRVARAEPSPPNGHRLRVAMVALVALLLVVSGAAARLAIRSVGERATTREAPPSSGQAVPPPAYAGYLQYQTLPEIVTGSDLVVVGTVQEVVPGYVEPSEDGFPTRYLNTVLKIDELWKGSVAETVTVATIDVEYGSLGGGSEWRTPGTRVVAFLLPGDSGPSGLFYPADEQGIYMLSGDTLVPTAPGTSLSDRIAAMSLEQLRQAVQAAEQAA